MAAPPLNSRLHFFLLTNNVFNLWREREIFRAFNKKVQENRQFHYLIKFSSNKVAGAGASQVFFTFLGTLSAANCTPLETFF